MDTITGVATLRAFGWVEDSLRVNNRLLDNSQRPAYLLAMIQRWLIFVLNIVAAVMAILVVVTATQVKSVTGIGFTGASLVTLMSFGNFVSHLITTYTLLETSMGAVSRLKSFSEKVLPESLPGEDIVPPQLWPPSGAVEIRGVSASYVYVVQPMVQSLLFGLDRS
jgi:ATP-binding cassette subfamily C (CFTR/MRP) protein 1